MNWSNVEEIFSQSDFGVDNSIHFNNPDLTKRLKKTLYYSPHKNPCKDTLSFSVTKAAVESFRKAAPTSCGKLGLRYASRVARDACLSPCAMILAMIYVERLIHKNPDYLQRIQSSDLFLITMMVASKYLYDEGTSDEVYNDEWAISGLADTDYVNDLEGDFLHAIEWRIFTRQEDFCSRLMLMEARLAYMEGCQRGWLTYTELSSILQSNKVHESFRKIASLLSKTICFSAALYCGVVMATCGLTLLMRHQSSLSYQNPAHSLPEENNASNSLNENTALNEDLSLVIKSRFSPPSSVDHTNPDQISSSTDRLQPSTDDKNHNYSMIKPKSRRRSNLSTLNLLPETNSSLPPSVSHRTSETHFFRSPVYTVTNSTLCSEKSKKSKHEVPSNREGNSHWRSQSDREPHIRDRLSLRLAESDRFGIVLSPASVFPSLTPSHFQHHHCTSSAFKVF